MVSLSCHEASVIVLRNCNGSASAGRMTSHVGLQKALALGKFTPHLNFSSI